MVFRYCEEIISEFILFFFLKFYRRKLFNVTLRIQHKHNDRKQKETARYYICIRAELIQI